MTENLEERSGYMENEGLIGIDYFQFLPDKNFPTQVAGIFYGLIRKADNQLRNIISAIIDKSS